METYQDYHRSVGRTEFWKQIKRTVNGQPVSEQDIQMIVLQVQAHLDLQHNDHLLDLGCGNGALSSRFFDHIGQFTGVDLSEYLLGVAEEFFQTTATTYVQKDIVDFVRDCTEDVTFTKVLIYGVVSYLTKDALFEVLTRTHRVFRKSSRIFIGNIPNKQKAAEFYANRGHTNYILDDPSTPIGIWWEPNELRQMCETAGYGAVELRMPDVFYGAPYRFDMLLTRRAS